jgi:hypothetical protein
MRVGIGFAVKQLSPSKIITGIFELTKKKVINNKQGFKT